MSYAKTIYLYTKSYNKREPELTIPLVAGHTSVHHFSMYKYTIPVDELTIPLVAGHTSSI